MAARILIVDDTPVNLMLLRVNLKKQGYDVVEAATGEAALRLVEEASPDLVLLDVMMPGVSGIDVLRSLRSRYTMAALPVIMATAMNESVNVVEALNLGANDYVTKPLDFPVVLARVRTHLAMKRLTEELELRNRFIRKTFGRYLSDDVVHSLLESEEGLRLGGETRTVTILMSDLRGFTAFSERLRPEEVVRTLNAYLGVMADIITRHRGTIDEFIGDAILAIFGAPIGGEDDAERAVACALEMQIAMEAVNRENTAAGLPLLEMGIGLDTGEVVVGNIGSLTRAKYGVVGSHVNLTARIESATVGGQILISEATLLAAGRDVHVGKAISVRAKGFRDEIRAHELLGLGGARDLRLPRVEEPLVTLSSAVPLLLALVDGKEAGEPRIPASMVKLSRHRCELVAPGAMLPPLTNVRIRLGPGVPDDVYAKVIDVADGDHVVAWFTSVPASAATYLADLLVTS